MRYKLLPVAVSVALLGLVALGFQNCGQGFQASPGVSLSSNSFEGGIPFDLIEEDQQERPIVSVEFSQANPSRSAEKVPSIQFDFQSSSESDDVVKLTCEIINARSGVSYAGSVVENCVSPYVSPVKLDNGEYNLNVRVHFSPTGEELLSRQFSFVIDLSGPWVVIKSSRLGKDVEVHFELSGSPEEELHASCRLNGENVRPCESPFQVSNLDEGDYQLTIVGHDELGNAGQVRSFSWRVVDNSRIPSIEIVEAPSDGVGGAYADFKFSSDLDGARYQCYSEPAPTAETREQFFRPCESQHRVIRSGQDVHSLHVRAVVGERISEPIVHEWKFAPIEFTFISRPEGGSTVGTADINGGVPNYQQNLSFDCQIRNYYNGKVSYQSVDGSCDMIGSTFRFRQNLPEGSYVFRVKALGRDNNGRSGVVGVYEDSFSVYSSGLKFSGFQKIISDDHIDLQLVVSGKYLYSVYEPNGRPNLIVRTGVFQPLGGAEASIATKSFRDIYKMPRDEKLKLPFLVYDGHLIDGDVGGVIFALNRQSKQLVARYDTYFKPGGVDINGKMTVISGRSSLDGVCESPATDDPMRCLVIGVGVQMGDVHGLVVRQDLRRAFSLDLTARKIMMFSLENGNRYLLPDIRLPASGIYTDLVWGEDERTFYATRDSSGTVDKISLDQKEVKAAASGFTSPVGLRLLGNGRALVLEASCKLYTVLLADGTKTFISGSDDIIGPTVAPSARCGALSLSRDKKRAIVSVSSGGVSKIVELHLDGDKSGIVENLLQ